MCVSLREKLRPVRKGFVRGSQTRGSHPKNNNNLLKNTTNDPEPFTMGRPLWVITEKDFVGNLLNVARYEGEVIYTEVLPNSPERTRYLNNEHRLRVPIPAVGLKKVYAMFLTDMSLFDVFMSINGVYLQIMHLFFKTLYTLV